MSLQIGRSDTGVSLVIMCDNPGCPNGVGCTVDATVLVSAAHDDGEDSSRTGPAMFVTCSTACADRISNDAALDGTWTRVPFASSFAQYVALAGFLPRGSDTTKYVDGIRTAVNAARKAK